MYIPALLRFTCLPQATCFSADVLIQHFPFSPVCGMNIIQNSMYEHAVDSTMEDPPVAQVSPEGAPGTAAAAPVDDNKTPELPEFDWKTVGTAMMSRRAYRRCAGSIQSFVALALGFQARQRADTRLNPTDTITFPFKDWLPQLAPSMGTLIAVCTIQHLWRVRALGCTFRNSHLKTQ